MSHKKPKPQDRTPADLLSSLADALNACQEGGVPVTFRHGAAFSRYGCVLPPAKKGGRWDARLFAAMHADSGGG